MSRPQHFIINTLNFNVHGEAKSAKLVGCSQRDAGMDYSLLCHFFLSLLSCYELNGTKETTLRQTMKRIYEHKRLEELLESYPRSP